MNFTRIDFRWMSTSRSIFCLKKKRFLQKKLAELKQQIRLSKSTATHKAQTETLRTELQSYCSVTLNWPVPYIVCIFDFVMVLFTNLHAACVYTASCNGACVTIKCRPPREE